MVNVASVKNTKSDLAILGCGVLEKKVSWTDEVVKSFGNMNPVLIDFLASKNFRSGGAQCSLLSKSRVCCN